MKIELSNRQWAALMTLVIIFIGAVVLIGVALSQPTPKERLIDELKNESLLIGDETTLMAIIDDTCPYLDGSYRGVRNLESFGMTTDQALDTLAIVRYSGYCD